MDISIELIKRYEEILAEQKSNRQKYTLINTGKEIIENFSSNLLPNFHNYQDPYVNLEKKFIKLISDLDIVNKNLTESYILWNKITNNTANIDPELIVFNSFYHTKLSKLNEYIAFDLKKFIDEVLATICVIKNKIDNDKLEISSIGNYLNSHDNTYNEFDEFLDLFKKLNDIINAYKHSYANTDFFAFGKDENCFTALYSKHNDFSKDLELYCVSVNYIVNEFNKFYKKAFEIIDNLTTSPTPQTS